MTAKQALKIIITSVAILVAVAHVLFPAAKIDMITVALIAMSIIPWVEPLFKSVGLPGGITFQFQDLEKIASQSAYYGREQLSKIEQMLDVEKNYLAAAEQVRSLMFITHIRMTTVMI